MRIFKILGKVGLISFIVIGLFGLYLIADSTQNPAVKELYEDTGPAGYLLIPGLNPYIPLVTGWIALFIAIVAHEGAHGIIARSVGVKVKSTGLVLLALLPIGAFCELDEKEMNAIRARDQAKILSAGVFSNIIFALAAVFGGMAINQSLIPSIDFLVFDLTELFFMIFLVNISLGIFNALPLVPLDGGRLFGLLVGSIANGRLSKGKENLIIAIISLMTLALVLFPIFSTIL